MDTEHKSKSKGSVYSSGHENMSENLTSQRHDESDALSFKRKDNTTDRPAATMPVVRASERYNMQHNNRGMAVIFAYSEYQAQRKLSDRIFAPHDVHLCTTAFQKLGYEVKIHWNLPRKDFFITLDDVRNENHSDSDSLVIIFMSHGGVKKKTSIEYLETYDDQVETIKLWSNFTPDKCPTLAGKPKMFFIQACRGDEADKGVELQNRSRMKVQTDSIRLGGVKKEEDYAIPLYADMLMMWASYPGTFAFNSYGSGVSGSVFLHFLTEIVNKYADKEDLSSMLLRLTREVAIHYESFCPADEYKHKNKQVPQTVSTLMRKVYFF